MFLYQRRCLIAVTALPWLAYFNFFSWCMINVSGGGMWETKPFNPPRFHLVLLCPLSRDKNSLWDWWMVARGMAKFEATPHLQLLCGWYLNMDPWSSERNSNSVQFWDVICLQVDYQHWESNCFKALHWLGCNHADSKHKIDSLTCPYWFQWVTWSSLVNSQLWSTSQAL